MLESTREGCSRKVRNMVIGRMGRWLLLSLVALLPASASAFSFGTFAGGDTIASIILGSTTGPLVTFTPGGAPADQLVFQGEITTIHMTSGAVFNISPGDVTFASTVMLQGGTQIIAPGSSPTFLSGGFANGPVTDFSIIDVAGGYNVLLEGDYIGNLIWTANQLFPGIVTGTLDGTFQLDTSSSDPAFHNAFGSQGTFFSQMSGFQSDGMAVTLACDMTNPGPPLCFLPQTSFDDWTSNPTATIQPLVPEPALGLLVATGMLGLGIVAARRKDA